MIIDQGARARERTRYLAPSAPLAVLLADWVVEGWIQRYDGRPDPRGAGWRIVPDLQPHLLVHGADGGGVVRGPLLVGPRSGWVDRPVHTRGWTAGVTLRPGALAQLVGLPGGEMRDRSVALDALPGGRCGRLAACVAAAPDPEGVVDLLFRLVAGEARRAAAPRDWRVRGFLELARATARPRVSELTAALGLSPRSLRQVWADEVGLSPKAALSIDRLHGAVAAAVTRPGTSWSRLARRAGYYDQPHLIRDFHRLLGETPEAFLDRGCRGPVGRE